MSHSINFEGFKNFNFLSRDLDSGARHVKVFSVFHSQLESRFIYQSEVALLRILGPFR